MDWTEMALLEALALLPAEFSGSAPFRQAAIRISGKQSHGEALRRKLLDRGWVVGGPTSTNNRNWRYATRLSAQK